MKTTLPLPALLCRYLLSLLALLPLAAAATGPVLTLQGTGGSGTDVTAFVDQVEIVNVATGAVVGGALANAGFETPSQAGVTGGYSYAPSGGAWTFGPAAGIARNGSVFGNPTAPEGSQVGLVQYTSSLQQALVLGAGTYQVRLRLAQRTCCGSHDQEVQVKVNNVVLGTVTPATVFTTYTTSSFTVFEVASLNPAANARAASRNTAVGVTFTGPVDAATAGTIKVFSAQYRGRRTATASTSGSTVTLTPTANSGAASFRPGETVQVSVPATVHGASGAAAGPYVYQFTAAVGGTGSGRFTAPATNPSSGVGNNPNSVVVGDVDGDGDLDMLTTNQNSNSVSVRLNDGTGNFTPLATNPDPAVGSAPTSVALGDVDGDGDLDFLTANNGSSTVSVRLNNGMGSFTAPATNPNPAVGNGPLSVALGDVDGDGDLDVLTANYGGTVSVRLNDGTGNFTAPATNPDPAVGSVPISIALGDVDGDGDLDVLTANYGDNTVSVRLNDGTGNFTPPATNPDPAVGSAPISVALGDVDGDGDLDLLTANVGDNTVSVRLNDGTGSFTAPATNPNPAVGNGPLSVALGDVDGDGDLDMLAANSGDNTVSVRLNDGIGNFTAPATNPNPAVGNGPQGVALGDVDGDGDLDALTANFYDNAVSVRLNQPPPPVLSSLSASSAAAGGALTLSGTFLTGATVATFTNTGTGAVTTVVAAAFTSTGYAVTPQTIGLLVPTSLAVGSYTVRVTTPGGTSNALPLTVRLLAVASLSPAANARAAARSTSVGVTFTGTVDAATAGTIKVFSAQYRGRRTTAVSTSGNTVTLTPTASSGAAAFKPGETVRVSVPATVHSTGGAAAVPYVYQFTTAVGGTGIGNFRAPAANADPAVGNSPQSVAVGDVDGDGDLDMLTANSGSSTVSVRLNDGSGSFSAPATNPNPAVGSGPGSVVLGDVDGDGDLDMLTANANDNTVSVRLNNGTGNFTAPATNPNPAVGSSPGSLALGDVDGDGDLDMLTANFGGNTVSVRLNDGTGNFTAPATNANPTVGSGPISVALGDVDGDGDLDLLTANYGGSTVSVRLNDGTGNFTPPATNPNPALGTAPYSVALGDVDGDGDLDLLAANSGSNTVSVRLNNGTGSFTGGSDPAVGSTPYSVALSDVDADGDLDLLTANHGGNTLSVRLNDGSGSFTAPATNANPAVGSYPTSVALGDVDGDGDLDVLTANSADNTVSVRLNQSAPPVLSSLSASSVVAGGALTLSGTLLTGATLVTFTNTGTGAATTVAASAFTSTGYAASPQTIGLLVPGLAAGSYAVSVTTPNGPSNTLPLSVRPLLVTSLNPAANARAAARSTPVGVTFTEPIDAATAGYVKVFSAQYRGRRTASASTSGNTVTLAPTASSGAAAFKPGETVQVSVPATVHSTGGAAAVPYVYQFTTAVGGTGRGNFRAPAANANPAVGSYPTSVALGDVDGDGDLDVLTANSADNTVSVRLNDGAGNFTGGSDPIVGSNPGSVVLGDVDGDGDLDLLTANFGSNTVSVRLNDGTGNFTAPATNPNPAVGSNPYSVALGDVDGDGDLDVLTANFNGNTVSVRLNDGAGNFTAPATNPNPTVDSGPQSVVLGDVDGDGDLDLLTANFNFGGTVSVRLNDGTGNFTAPATNPNPAVGNLPIGLALGDVDGDGDLDLLTTNSYDNTVSVRLNDGTGSFTAPATNPNPTVGSGPQSVALSDVDGDGDLDMLTANADDNTVSVRLNDGTGNFTAPATNPNPAVGNNPSGLALGDVDGDGDLDVLTANFDDNTVSVRLNQPPAPVLSSLSASSAAAGGALTLSGTLLTGATLVTFTNTSTGAATTVAASAFTSTGYAATPQTIGLLVPAGLAGGAYSVSVTTPGGTSNALLLTVRLQVTALSPAANARAAARNTTVGLTFSGPIDAATAGNIRVFSAQYRGRRTATASTSGNTVTLTPTASSGAASFQPGETVRVSVPATVQGTGGAAAGPYVYQFTTAVGGTGRGNFRAPATNPNPGVGSNSFSVAVGDVDGDGDLDMLTANGGDNTVSVRLNDGAGNFTAPAINPNPAVGFNPKSIAVGDVDGDGDLDLLTANSGTNIVSVRLNDGTGNFTPPATNPSPAVGSGPLSVALGDVDGDGDLDLLTANYLNNTVSVRLNDGTGNFTPPATNPDPAVGSNPTSVAVGDVDGDGDLDMLTANASDNTVSVRLNDGTGNFTPPATNPNPAVGSSPNSVALADVDGDGDLDLLTANGNFGSSGTVSVRLNDGTGNFTPPATNPNPAVGSYPQSLAVGDVDGDGDLDLLTANRGDNTVSVRLNDGTGNFAALAANASPGVGSSPTGVALGDVDGDGDLDLLAANYGASTVSVRLNQPPAPVLSSLSASSAAAGGALTLSGTFLAGATLATFTNTSTGAATTVAAGAFTSTGYAASPQTIGLLVPAGLAAGSYTVSVTTPNGTSNALPLTVCVLTVAVQNVSVPLGASGTVSVPASAFNNGSTSTCGPVTAQVSSQGTVTGQVNENGLLTLTAPAGAVFTAVTFASYGTPTYANGTYALGSCHAPSSQSVVEAVALGQHTFSISAENVVFGGDPCPNTFKQLVVQATYTNAPAPQLTYSCNSVGTFPVLVTLTDANGTSQQAPATVTVTVPAATSTTWTGTASPDWTDCQNWSYGRLPSATIDAVVPGGLVNYPVLASSTGAVQNLLVASGASLTVATGATLEVTGDFTTNGPVSLAGTISLTGSAPVQALSSPAAFSTLLVDKAVGTVVLQRNLAVGSALTLASGTLATGSFQVVLGSAATLTESNTAYVTGAIATTRPLAAGTAESFGGLGLTLTPATGSTSPGSTAVVRTTGTALRGAGTSQSILRYFDIQPATNSGLNVTLDLSYLDHERNGIAAASVALFKSVNGVGGPWQAQLPITISGNTVRKTGITDFSVWTLGSAANPLPVELTTFTAEAQGTTALLRWTTASEHNSDHFEVEASADGTAFGRIGTVAAQGSSLTAHAYRFVDAQLAGYGSPQVYYRLRQVDLDGTFAYSPVRVVAVGSSSQAGFQVYPTLRAAGEPLRYVLAGALAGQAAGAELTVYTTTGQQVSAQHLAAGATGLVALPPLPTGWYLVRLRTADGTAFSARFGVQ